MAWLTVAVHAALLKIELSSEYFTGTEDDEKAAGSSCEHKRSSCTET
jgi:hypothetical protein